MLPALPSCAFRLLSCESLPIRNHTALHGAIENNPHHILSDTFSLNLEARTTVLLSLQYWVHHYFTLQPFLRTARKEILCSCVLSYQTKNMTIWSQYLDQNKVLENNHPVKKKKKERNPRNCWPITRIFGFCLFSILKPLLAPFLNQEDRFRHRRYGHRHKHIDRMSCKVTMKF